jgi:hypothetical protein
MVAIVSIGEVTDGDEDVGGVGPASGSGAGTAKSRIEAHRRRRQSLAAFCAQRGLRKRTFSFWKWKLKQEALAGIHVVFWPLPREMRILRDRGSFG